MDRIFFQRTTSSLQQAFYFFSEQLHLYSEYIIFSANNFIFTAGILFLQQATSCVERLFYFYRDMNAGEKRLPGRLKRSYIYFEAIGKSIENKIRITVFLSDLKITSPLFSSKDLEVASPLVFI